MAKVAGLPLANASPFVVRHQAYQSDRSTASVSGVGGFVRMHRDDFRGLRQCQGTHLPGSRPVGRGQVMARSNRDIRQVGTRLCERCSRLHLGTFGSGRFCSMHCAKSRHGSTTPIWKEGYRGDWTGKKHTDETKKKMSETARRLWREDRPHVFTHDKLGRFIKKKNT